jgi:hypothetical protein
LQLSFLLTFLDTIQSAIPNQPINPPTLDSPTQSKTPSSPCAIALSVSHAQSLLVPYHTAQITQAGCIRIDW